MKAVQSILLSAILLASAGIAAPQNYPAPPGGYENVDYPDGTGENLPSYPAPPGGYENVAYPPGTGAGAVPACTNGPFTFTSTYHVTATPDQVVNGTTFTGGLAVSRHPRQTTIT